MPLIILYESKVKFMSKLLLESLIQLAPAGVAQWIEHGPANHRVASLIPSQGTCLACRPGPW